MMSLSRSESESVGRSSGKIVRIRCNCRDLAKFRIWLFRLPRCSHHVPLLRLSAKIRRVFDLTRLEMFGCEVDIAVTCARKIQGA